MKENHYIDMTGPHQRVEVRDYGDFAEVVLEGRTSCAVIRMSSVPAAVALGARLVGDAEAEIRRAAVAAYAGSGS